MASMHNLGSLSLADQRVLEICVDSVYLESVREHDRQKKDNGQ